MSGTRQPEAAERLQKLLARAGFGSRRACEELITAGRVRVNGRVATLGQRADPRHDVVEVDGLPVQPEAGHVYLALHKPSGVVTTARDPQGRPTVMDLVPTPPRLFPVGRLDYETSGLLLMTNDGELALRVAHPRYGLSKTYVAEVRGAVSDRALARLRRGIELEDGLARADEARTIGKARDRTLVEVVVREGRNRLVRRLFEASGLEIASLVRVAIGPLRLGRLKPGAYRTLGREEVSELVQATEAQPQPREAASGAERRPRETDAGGRRRGRAKTDGRKRRQ